MSTMTLPIQCFGVFRQFGNEFCVTVEVGASILHIKEALVLKLGVEHEALIKDSVLANENEILPNAYILKTETTLSVLPPVCGG